MSKPINPQPAPFPLKPSPTVPIDLSAVAKVLYGLAQAGGGPATPEQQAAASAAVAQVASYLHQVDNPDAVFAAKLATINNQADAAYLQAKIQAAGGLAALLASMWSRPASAPLGGANPEVAPEKRPPPVLDELRIWCAVAWGLTISMILEGQLELLEYGIIMIHRGCE